MANPTQTHDPEVHLSEPQDDPQVVSPAATPEAASGGKLFTIREVVAACAISDSTAKRRLKEGAFPNAFQAGADTHHIEGTWLIPLADLLAAGYNPGRPTEGDPQTASATSSTTTRPGSPSDADASLREALDRAEAAEAELVRTRAREEAASQRAKFAEGIAYERERTIKMLDAALRMLEAGPTAPRVPRSRPPVDEAANPGRDSASARRWWQRSRRHLA